MYDSTSPLQHLEVLHSPSKHMHCESQVEESAIVGTCLRTYVSAHVWMDGCMHACRYGNTYNVFMIGKMYVRMDGRMDGRTDGWMEERMDGWMYASTDVRRYV